MAGTFIHHSLVPMCGGGAWQVVASSNLDPTEVQRMTDSLDDVLMERNNMVKELQYMVARASKVKEHGGGQ